MYRMLICSNHTLSIDILLMPAYACLPSRQTHGVVATHSQHRICIIGYMQRSHMQLHQPHSQGDVLTALLTVTNTQQTSCADHSRGGQAVTRWALTNAVGPP